MLWSEPGIVFGVALLGGIFGGGIMAFSNRMSHKFNIQCLEQYWRADIKRLESRIDTLSLKIISTNSVDNLVGNQEKGSNNNGYNRERHFNQKS